MANIPLNLFIISAEFKEANKCPPQPSLKIQLLHSFKRIKVLHNNFKVISTSKSKFNTVKPFYYTAHWDRNFKMSPQTSRNSAKIW